MSNPKKIVFTKQAAAAIDSQEMLDVIESAMQAIIDGGELPEGVEIRQVTSFDEDDIQEILATCAGMPAHQLAELEQAMRDGDMEKFADILMNDGKDQKLH